MEEGTGIDQGDPTPTPDTWPTEPDRDTSEPASEAPVTDHTTTVSGGDGGEDQLPTTSGADMAAVGSLGLLAVLIVAAGLILMRRRRSRHHW